MKLKKYTAPKCVSHEYLGVKDINTLASSDLLLLIAGRACVYTLFETADPAAYLPSHSHLPI